MTTATRPAPSRDGGGRIVSTWAAPSHETAGKMDAVWTSSSRSKKRARRHMKRQLWNGFVMLVGYAAILYGLARGVIYVLVLLGGLA